MRPLILRGVTDSFTERYFTKSHNPKICACPAIQVSRVQSSYDGCLFQPNMDREHVAIRTFKPACKCGWSGDVNGLMAIQHWVEPWEQLIGTNASG
jgi:hypothetical protein